MTAADGKGRSGAQERGGEAGKDSRRRQALRSSLFSGSTAEVPEKVVETKAPADEGHPAGGKEVSVAPPVEKESADQGKVDLAGQGAALVTDSPVESSSPGTQIQASNWRTTRTGEHQLMGASIKFFLPKEERERAERFIAKQASPVGNLSEICRIALTQYLDREEAIVEEMEKAFEEIRSRSIKR